MGRELYRGLSFSHYLDEPGWGPSFNPSILQAEAACKLAIFHDACGGARRHPRGHQEVGGEGSHNGNCQELCRDHMSYGRCYGQKAICSKGHGVQYKDSTMSPATLLA